MLLKLKGKFYINMAREASVGHREREEQRMQVAKIHIQYFSIQVESSGRIIRSEYIETSVGGDKY